MVSRKVSQALLSLLLIRETQFTHSEFAVRAGLGGESIPLALRVSEQAGLLHSIPHGVKHEAMDCMVNPPHPTPVLPDTIQARDQEGNDVGGAGASNGVTAKTIGGRPTQGPGTPINTRGNKGRGGENGGGGQESGILSPLMLCRRADEAGDRRGQVAALQAAWAEAFPLQDYEYQQLQVQAAKSFLVGRTAEEVGEVILDAPKRTKSKIESPRAYIESVLAGKKSRDEDEPIITDELRALARQAKEQIRARKAADQRRRDDYGAS